MLTTRSRLYSPTGSTVSLEVHVTVLSSAEASSLRDLPTSASVIVSAPVEASRLSVTLVQLASSAPLAYQVTVSLASSGRAESDQLEESGIRTLGVSVVPTLSVAVEASAGSTDLSVY